MKFQISLLSSHVGLRNIWRMTYASWWRKRSFNSILLPQATLIVVNEFSYSPFYTFGLKKEKDGVNLTREGIYLLYPTLAKRLLLMRYVHPKGFARDKRGSTLKWKHPEKFSVEKYLALRHCVIRMMQIEWCAFFVWWVIHNWNL